MTRLELGSCKPLKSRAFGNEEKAFEFAIGLWFTNGYFSRDRQTDIGWASLIRDWFPADKAQTTPLPPLAGHDAGIPVFPFPARTPLSFSVAILLSPRLSRNAAAFISLPPFLIHLPSTLILACSVSSLAKSPIQMLSSLRCRIGVQRQEGKEKARARVPGEGGGGGGGGVEGGGWRGQGGTRSKVRRWRVGQGGKGDRLLFGGRSGLWGTREKRGAQHYDAKMARLRHPRISSSTRHWPLGKPLLR